MQRCRNKKSRKKLKSALQVFFTVCRFLINHYQTELKMSSFLFASCLMTTDDPCCPNRVNENECKVPARTEVVIQAKKMKDECDQPKYIKSLREQMGPSKDKSIIKTTISDARTSKTSLRNTKKETSSDTQTFSQNLKSLTFSSRKYLDE